MIAPELLRELHTKSVSFGRKFADQCTTSLFGKELMEGGEDKVMAIFHDELRYKVETMRAIGVPQADMERWCRDAALAAAYRWREIAASVSPDASATRQ